MVAGDIRRKVEDTEPLSFEDIALKCLDMEPRNSCLAALIYLSGRRVNEVLALQKKDFRVEEKRISFETFNEKVYRKKPTGNFNIEKTIVKEGLEFPIVRFYERIRPHWRTDTESGKALTLFVSERLGSLNENDYLFKSLRGSEHIKYQMAYKIIRFNFPDAWPHLLRHERFTEVAKVYRSDPVAMHRFTFHKRFESTLQYIRNLEEEKI